MGIGGYVGGTVLVYLKEEKMPPAMIVGGNALEADKKVRGWIVWANQFSA